VSSVAEDVEMISKEPIDANRSWVSGFRGGVDDREAMKG